jgi:hypothetical protein
MTGLTFKKKADGTFEFIGDGSVPKEQQEHWFFLTQKQYYENRGEEVPDWILEGLKHYE